MQMNEQPYLSVIISAYNEGGRKGEEFKKNLEDIGKYLGQKGISYEVVIINDGSKDNTAEFASNLSYLVSKLEVIGREKNRGKGYSLREGFLKARGEFRLITDADGSTSIINLDGFWKHMKNGENVIIGSRDLNASKIEVHQPKWKEWMGNIGNVLIQFMLGLRGIEDTQCGFKVFSQKAAEDIFTQMKVDRWGWDFEALALARKMGYEIVQVPVTWADAGKSLVGTTGLGGYSTTLKELFQVKWRMITGQYKYKK